MKTFFVLYSHPLAFWLFVHCLFQVYVNAINWDISGSTQRTEYRPSKEFTGFFFFFRGLGVLLEYPNAFNMKGNFMKTTKKEYFGLYYVKQTERLRPTQQSN